MLKEINCDKFRTKKIEFNSKLNVVLGDHQATNSIGKSTLLMIVDFVFGGESYLKHNRDVVDELGDHKFNFKMVFDSQPFFFQRSTDDSGVVYKCDSNYNKLSDLTIIKYTDFLKNKYGLQNLSISFRSIVGLYARVWGKPNAFVKKPLQLFDNEKDKDAIVKLIKLFDKYDELKDLLEKIQKEKEQRKTFNKAVKDELLPNVTKTDFKKGEILIDSVESELEDIKSNILKYTVNVSEITNKELLVLKYEKEDLLKVKLRLENKLKRLLSNLEEKSPIKSKHIEKLISFFPTSNVNKIEQIEVFHSKLFKILKKEFLAEKSHVTDRLNLVQTEIKEIDIKIDLILGDSGNPIKVVNRIYDLTYQAKDLKTKKETFQKKQKFAENIKEWDGQLENKAKLITDEIQEEINTSLIKFNEKVHSSSRAAPTFLFNTNSCSFEIPKNTGTGKAYIDLILFDLSVYELTGLPVLVHDSFLFKNIENSSMSNLARVYNSFSKQTFIAVDEIEKYDSGAQQIFKSKRCIQLSDNQLLFIKDWRELNA